MPPTALTGPDGFGEAVSGAGDVDADGFADVIVGSADENRFYIYFGAAGGLRAGRTRITNVSATSFGLTVATAGDVNGDGFADVLVGAPAEDRAFIYFGTVGNISTQFVQLDGPVTNSFFGGAVDTAGDVNNDGLADVIIGALAADEAYIYLGAATTLPTLPTLAGPVTLAEGLVGDEFGWSVSTAGDVNGDGISDVIVGAPTGNAAYIFTGEDVALPTLPTLTVLPTLTGTGGFGSAVSTAGDVDSDGLADVLVGAPDNAEATLYYGATAGPTITTTVTGAAGSWFGMAVNTAGDVNGDGFADVLVGAPILSDSGLTDAGQMALYTGAPDLPTPTGEAEWRLNGSGISGFGWSFEMAGDVNGDGYTDAILGAPGANRVFVYHGSASGLSLTAAVTLTMAGATDFGYSVGAAGDVDGDGYGDVIIGEASFPNTTEGTGRALVYRGSPGGVDASSPWTLDNPSATGADDRFGWSVATAGDVNGDGYSDVMVGAPLAENGGAVYVYYGQEGDLSTTPDWSAENSGVAIRLGHSVATAGDVNGDGYADVMMGAPSDANGGAVLVFHGSPTGLDTGSRPAGTPDNADWSIVPGDPLAGNDFGQTVSTAGDVNGDGYSDVVVNARGVRHNPNDGLVGKVYAFYGSAGGLRNDGAADWEVDVVMGGNPISRMVNTAGDVNNDGYADVIIGADVRQTINGKAALYLGSSTGLDTAVAQTFAEPFQEFGWSVSAGDVNGDGYADIFVSTKQRARAFVYYGNTGGVPGPQTVRPRQLRVDEPDIQIGPLGNTDVLTGVRLSLFGRMPLGRAAVALEWQVAPLGTPFDGAGVIVGTQAVSTTGTVIDPVVEGLAPGTVYHWRVRLRYPVGSRLGQVASRWLRIPHNGDQEQNFRSTVGLILRSDSPTQLGRTTAFTATLGGATALNYRWDFDINTPPTEDLQTTAGDTQHTYAATGVYTASVTVEYQLPGDPTIRAISAETVVEVIDTIPRLAVVNDSPTRLNDTTTFTATLGGIDLTEPITYTWDFDDGVTPPLTTGGNVVGHTYPAVGVYTASVRAAFTRVSGVPDELTVTTVVTIEEGIAGLVADSDSPTQVGSLTTLTASLTDGTNVQYFWDFESDGTIDVVSPPNTASPYAATFTYPAVGLYTATVTARNAVSEQTAQTVVEIGDVPVAGLTADSDSPTQVGDTTTLTATITAGTNVTYTWDFENDGVADAFSPPGVTNRYAVTHVYPAVGTYTAVVRAYNGAGVVAAQTTVVIGDVPVSGLTATNDSPTELGSATVLTATIAGGTNVQYLWDFDDDGTIDDTSPAGAGNVYSVSFTYPAVGTYVATVTARNGAGEVERQTIVTVVDVPIAGLTAANDGPTQVGSVTTLTATITVGTNVTYTWDFENDGVFDVVSPVDPGGIYGGDGVYTATFTYPAVGTYTAVVRAANGAGVVSATTVVEVVDVPITNLTAANDGPTRLGSNTTLTATIGAGTNVTYRWDFDGDGRVDRTRPANTPSPVVETFTYAAVGLYTATVTAANGAGEVAADTVVAVVDVPIAGLTASNDGPTLLGSATTLTAQATAGTNVTYLWDFNGDGTTDLTSPPDTASPYAVTFTYPAVGTYTARVTARNSAGEVTQETEVQVVAPVLVISKQAPATVRAGARITYTLTVSNTGNAVASTLVITDVLPTGANFVTASGGGQLAGGEVRWQVASLAAGATTSVQLVVTSTQTIVNARYGVSAGGNFAAAGMTPVTVRVQALFNVFLPTIKCSQQAVADPAFEWGCGLPFEGAKGSSAAGLHWACDGVTVGLAHMPWGFRRLENL